METIFFRFLKNNLHGNTFFNVFLCTIITNKITEKNVLNIFLNMLNAISSYQMSFPHSDCWFNSAGTLFWANFWVAVETQSVIISKYYLKKLFVCYGELPQ